MPVNSKLTTLSLCKFMLHIIVYRTGQQVSLLLLQLAITLSTDNQLLAATQVPQIRELRLTLHAISDFIYLLIYLFTNFRLLYMYRVVQKSHTSVLVLR